MDRGDGNGVTTAAGGLAHETAARALHVTNGDSTASVLGAAGAREVLPWRDVLHEGPVPLGIGPDALRGVRASFLARSSGGREDDIEADLERRDMWLASAVQEGQEVVLWFEHDLYDQLQILQILDSLSARRGDRVQLIQVDRFPGRPRFAGLGELTPAEIVTLWPERRPVSGAQQALASRAWEAFRSDDPREIERLVHGDTSALPFLADALRRHLRQLPWTADGLAEDERAMLDALRGQGRATPVELFAAAAGREPSPFMGDLTAFWHLASLAGGDHPLVEPADPGIALPQPHEEAFQQVELRLTSTGERVLAGELDRVAVRGFDRWLGGVHVDGLGTWRWDAEAGRVVPPR
jgi:hypothetical protein